MGRRGRPGAGFGAGPMVRGGRRSAAVLGDRAREQIAEAHQLAASGQWAEAAPALSRLAGIARERGLSRMAATLGARAAQGYARTGDRDAFLAATEAAIGDAKVEGDADHGSRTFGELLAAVSDTTFSGLVPDLEGAIRQALGATPTRPSAEAPTMGRSVRRHLPASCEACGSDVEGATLRFNERGDADCPTCGSVLTSTL